MSAWRLTSFRGQAQGGNAYSYSLGSSKATLVAAITRDKQGKLQGGIHLVNENDGWRVDALDTAPLGANLSVLRTLDAYCVALKGQDYAKLYALTGADLHGDANQAQFSAFGLLQDLLDGKVTACSLTAIVGGNTETATTVTVTITRGTLGQKSGNVTLEGSGDSWTITKMDRAVRGRDFQPLFTGTTFSLRIVGGDFAGAYQLGSASFQKTLTQAQLAQMFALPAGGKWLICGPDITTSTVTDTTAHYDGRCEWLDAASTPHLVAVSFDFVLEGTVWKVDRVTRKDS